MSDTKQRKTGAKNDAGHDGEQDEIIHAIRRIMQAEEAILSDDPEVHLASDAARTRIFAALDRLTGGEGSDEVAPTVLEALILERPDPLLSDWIDQHMPRMVERLVREEIAGRVRKSHDT